MICRAKKCHSEAIVGTVLCGFHDEQAEEGIPFEMKRPDRKRPRSPEYLERESQRRAAVWAEKKAERQAKRDHAKEYIHALIASRNAGPVRCKATAKKGSQQCQFHARYGDYCYIHRAMQEVAA